MRVNRLFRVRSKICIINKCESTVRFTYITGLTCYCGQYIRTSEIIPFDSHR